MERADRRPHLRIAELPYPTVIKEMHEAQPHPGANDHRDEANYIPGRCWDHPHEAHGTKRQHTAYE